MEEESDSSSVISSSNESDEDSELSDSAKNVLLYSVDAMKRYIAINRITRIKNSPLLDVSECIKSLDTERLRLFGQALRDDKQIRAVELCLDMDCLDIQLAKDIAVFLEKSPVVSFIELNRNPDSLLADGMDTKFVRVFLHAFLRNPNARGIYLWGIQSNESSLPDIVKAVSICQSLQSVKCFDCSVATAMSLIQGVILQKNVMVVDFSGIAWTDETNHLLQLLVVNVQSLQTLKLGSISFELLHCIAADISKLPHLSSLEFKVQKIEKGNEVKATKLITKVIAQSRSLRSLALSRFHWQFDSDSISLDGHVPVNHSLESLRIGGDSKQHDIYLWAILSPWRSLRCLDIRELCGNLIIGESLNKISQTHVSLYKITFRLLDDNQVRKLVDVLRKQSTLQSISFQMRSVTRETKEYMMNALMSPNSSLLHLSISDGFANDSNLLDHLSRVVAEGNCTLISLHIDLLDDPCTSEHVDRFFQGMRTNTKLLNLSTKGELSVEGCLSVCRHLPYLTALKSLHYEIPTQFEEDHEYEFVAAMTANTSLTKVALGMNGSRLESIGEFYTTRNRTEWMFAEKDRRAFWPNILWKYDESALFEFVYELSNRLHNGKRKAEDRASAATFETHMNVHDC
jgi:hypothetical protein